MATTQSVGGKKNGVGLLGIRHPRVHQPKVYFGWAGFFRGGVCVAHKKKMVQLGTRNTTPSRAAAQSLFWFFFEHDTLACSSTKFFFGLCDVCLGGGVREMI